MRFVTKKKIDYKKCADNVNSVAWAPHDFGLVLACGSSDGAISVLTYSTNNQWEAEKINNAHTIGCNSVGWCPSVSAGKRLGYFFYQKKIFNN